ncbi:MAG: hypothetical protein ACK4YP_11205 [Myxococcota bacterium]
MPTLPPRGPVLVLTGGLAALLLGAFAADGASSTLVTPPPGAALVPVFLIALGVGFGLVWPLGAHLTSRLVRRLTVLATLAVAFWSVGTMGRGLYATMAFASDRPLEREWTTWRVLGGSGRPGGAQSLPVSSFALKRSLGVDFDAEAVEEIGSGIACVSLALERTEAGDARIVLPDEALGVEDLEACPAVTRLGG